MLTIAQANRLNHMKPGQVVEWNAHEQMACHASKPYLSMRGCQQCALHKINCDAVKCLEGMTYHDTGPDGEPLEATRKEDVYFTIYLK